MLTQSNLTEIKKIVQEFFQKMTFEVEAKFLPPIEQTLPISLKTDEPQILIGERGQTLAEIQHLLKAILRRKVKTEEPFYLDLDINDYKKKKNEYLKELAHSLADEVSLSKKEKILPPMPAYERRVIHMELAGRSDVVSESTGEGLERRVVIRPYSP
jgi:spoIIIJ-associated protein